MKNGWFPFFLILLVALLVLSLLQIRVSTRTQLMLASVGIASILLMSVIVLANGGDSGLTLEPFNPSRIPTSNGFFLGLVLAFTAFIGFEAAAVLGEETAEPRKAIPRAILGAVIVAAFVLRVRDLVDVGRLRCQSLSSLGHGSVCA